MPDVAKYKFMAMITSARNHVNPFRNLNGLGRLRQIRLN